MATDRLKFTVDPKTGRPVITQKPPAPEDHLGRDHLGNWDISTGEFLIDGMAEIARDQAEAEAQKRKQAGIDQPIPDRPIPAHLIPTAPFLASIAQISTWTPWWRMNRLMLAIVPWYRVPELHHLLQEKDCYMKDGVAMIVLGTCSPDGRDKEGHDVYRSPSHFDPQKAVEYTQQLRAAQIERELAQQGGTGLRIHKLERELDALRRGTNAN
jgi:hypothetical protein